MTEEVVVIEIPRSRWKQLLAAEQRAERLREALVDIERCNDIGADGSLGCDHCLRVSRAALAADSKGGEQ